MSQKTYGKGEVIFQKGDYGDSLFQILKGSVNIVLDGGKDNAVLTELTEGKFFGEMGALTACPRSATAIVHEDGTVLREIAWEEMDACFGTNPEIILELMKHLSQRLRSLTKEYEDASSTLDQIKGKEKPEVSEGLRTKIARFLTLHRSEGAGKAQISIETRKKLTGMEHAQGKTNPVKAYPAGAIIFREGEDSPAMYDIHWGRIGIFTGYGTANERRLTELAANNFFGELGMLDGEPRSATAVVLEDQTSIEEIRPEDLAELFKINPNKVWMIFAHLSKRLTQMTEAFDEVCTELDKLQG
ncbi:MAG: cyclic nucleotide-binding domain-containing protein [Clostridia bacterium]|nr:cyclic nucleotide-binding domain-containing protein [Clostridia bacterium]